MSSAVVSTEAALSPKELGDGSSNTARVFFNGEADKRKGNGGAAENGKVASLNLESSPTRSEKRRSIQFSEPPEVVNRTYESVDDMVPKMATYQRPVTVQLPPTQGTGPSPPFTSAPGMEIGIRPQQMGLGMGRRTGALPIPPQDREPTDEYVAMAPPLPR